MRGQFVRRDGLIVPNNISLAGAQMILAAAFQNTVPEFYVALVQGYPKPGMMCADMIEPTIGVNGYARGPVPRSNVGWPNVDNIGNEAYIESAWLTWAAQDPGFNQPINRLALVPTAVYNGADPVYALSAALPEPFTITAETPQNQRQWKYQVFI